MQKITLLIFALFFCNLCKAQVFGFKAGASLATTTIKYEQECLSRDGMLNYFYELYYCQRIRPKQYFGVGLCYLGSGATLHNIDGATDSLYNVSARFSYVGIPIKFKISHEARAKIRPYGFLGITPCYMFNEERTKTFFFKNMKDNGNYLFNYSPRKLNANVFIGGGLYWKHFTFDIQAFTFCWRNYHEDIAPVGYNMGTMVTLGYQVSKATNKMW